MMQPPLGNSDDGWKVPGHRLASIRKAARGLLAALGVSAVLLAQRGLALDPNRSVDQYNCQHWTRQNGLPADKINDVMQSPDGYIWLGTRNGLVRFDGVEFKVIPMALPQPEGHAVRKFCLARDGEIRMAILDGGFGSYDGQKFYPLGTDAFAQPDLGAKTILEARDGTVWTGGDLGTGHSVPGDPAASFLGPTNTGTVLSLAEDAAGRVWFGTAERGLFYWAEGKFVAVPDPFLESQDIAALAVGTNGTIWAGTGRGLRCFAHGQFQMIPPLEAVVTALLVDRHGVLWVGTSGQGVGRLHNGQFDWLNKNNGLGSDNVTSLWEDTEGSLWIGTQDGLSQLADVKFPICTSEQGIGLGGSHAVAAAKNGGLWIGTDNGISWFDGRSATNYNDPQQLPNGYVKLVFEASTGDIYAEDGDKTINVFSGNRLLSRSTNETWVDAIAEDNQSVLVAKGDTLWRLQGGKASPYQFPAGEAPEFYWINSLYTAKDGAVWVACRNGIFRVDSRTVQHWSTGASVAENNVQWICEDGDGTLWAGLNTGIARIRDEQIKFIRSADGLADNWIHAIVPDDYGYLWCDSGSGIFRVSRQNLNDFADGKTGRVQCQLYDGQAALKSTGRTDQENSGCKTRDGKIWFPCPWGVVMIDPAHIPTNPVPPPVHIDRVLANGREWARGESIVVPPGPGELEIHFTGLSFIPAQNVRFRYQLSGYDEHWVEAGNRRAAFYTNLKPGQYRFHVIAANADGVWNETGDALKVELGPFFHQTTWYYLLMGGLGLAGLAGLYGWRMRAVGLKQRALQQSRLALESEVTHRTAELARANVSLQEKMVESGRMQIEIEHAQKALLESSRQAGMAEVATNVLHNVGNVLNSVNVSATLVADNLRNSKITYVGKVAALLEGRATDLGAFMTKDPQGRQLPGFLSELAGQLAKEQQNAVEELSSLRQNIEHIKDIVARQQNYAKISGVSEVIPASELVEDALMMNALALARHDIILEREYLDVPLVTVEKHKVLQILVNLIRNAKHACVDSGKPGKKIQLHIARTGHGVNIAVQDNGIGIPPENLARIFNHGFTTRKDGHGFGLHSGALAARELGGALTVHSEGTGQGATFTLTLPLSPGATN